MAKQKVTDDEIISYIKGFIMKNGFPPTFREIGKGVGLKSTATVSFRLGKLADAGRIDYVPKRAGTLKVVM